MSIKKLREDYGNVKTWQAMNRAIRAEIPGGAELLDAICLAAPLSGRSQLGGRLFEKLQESRAKMCYYIVRQYKLKLAIEKASKSRGRFQRPQAEGIKFWVKKEFEFEVDSESRKPRLCRMVR